MHFSTSCWLVWSGGPLLRWNAVELEWRAAHKDHKLSVLVWKGWICCHSLGFPFANGGAYFPFTFDDFDLWMECKLFSQHLKQLGCRAARGTGRNPATSTLRYIWWMGGPSAFACGAFYFINSGDGLINSSCHNRAAIRWPWLRHCASSLVPHPCCILSRCSRWAIWGLERAMGASYLFMMQLRGRRDRIWTCVPLSVLALSQRVSDWVFTTVHSGRNVPAMNLLIPP